MTTLNFADGRIKLFSYIMANLGTYCSFQYGDSVKVSIQGNAVSFCDDTWHTISTTTIN